TWAVPSLNIRRVIAVETLPLSTPTESNARPLILPVQTPTNLAKGDSFDFVWVCDFAFPSSSVFFLATAFGFGDSSEIGAGNRCTKLKNANTVMTVTSARFISRD